VAQPKVVEEFFMAPDGKPAPTLGEPESHFIRYGFKRGPLRLRGYSQNFRPSQPTNLTLQLRALLGINDREYLGEKNLAVFLADVIKLLT
jgi:hypothetical protein